MKRVSIVIIAFNIERYIDKCIKSVINQTFKDIEIVIVNDGSTDNTLNIIKENEINDKRIMVISQRNKGAIEARKTGFNKCQGKYVLFVDGDDWLEANTVELLYNKAEEDKSDIVVFNSYIVNEVGEKSIRIFNDNKYSDNDILKNTLIGEASPFLWDKFITKAFIEKNNIKFPENVSYSEDLAFLISIYSKKPKVSIKDKPLYNYYQRNDSATKKLNNKSIDIYKSMNFIEKILKDNNLYSIYNEEFDMCIYLNLFIYVVINFEKHNQYNKKLYKIYKEKNINKNKNIYIYEYINSYNKNGYIRINSYNISYYLGRGYDLMRKALKFVINE